LQLALIDDFHEISEEIAGPIDETRIARVGNFPARFDHFSPIQPFVTVKRRTPCPGTVRLFFAKYSAS
jgi:hypothetical protein